MALDREQLKKMMKVLLNADRSAPVAYSYNGEGFSYDAINATVREQLRELGGSHGLVRENKNLIYSLIEETIDDILPKQIVQKYSGVAEVKVVGQGDKVKFRRKSRGKQRAKQFVTRVGLNGIYEVFKLAGGESYDVPTSAIGAAAQIGLEEYLDGRIDFNELYQIILEGMDELIYKEALQALKTGINQLPVANRVSVAGFDEQTMDNLLQVASAYGTPTIYCTMEFAVKMIPLEAWKYSDSMKEELWTRGHFTKYKSYPVVILDQAFEDETNARKVIDPGYVWIIPSGAEKPIKIVLEGDTIIEDKKNQDWSQEVQVYKKVGVVALLTNDICSYVDTSLAGKMDTWNLTPSGVKNTVTIDGTVSTTTV